MHGEEPGYKGAPPGGASHPVKNQKDEDGIGGVEQQAGEMVSAGAHAEQLAIQRDRKPGQRVPKAAFQAAEGPADGFPSEAVLDMHVLIDVNRVIEVDELVAN